MPLRDRSGQSCQPFWHGVLGRSGRIVQDSWIGADGGHHHDCSSGPSSGTPIHVHGLLDLTLGILRSRLAITSTPFLDQVTCPIFRCNFVVWTPLFFRRHYIHELMTTFGLIHTFNQSPEQLDGELRGRTSFLDPRTFVSPIPDSRPSTSTTRSTRLRSRSRRWSRPDMLRASEKEKKTFDPFPVSDYIQVRQTIGTCSLPLHQIGFPCDFIFEWSQFSLLGLPSPGSSYLFHITSHHVPLHVFCHDVFMSSCLVSYGFLHLSVPHPPWNVVLLPIPLAVTDTDPLAVQSLLDPVIALHLVKKLTAEPTNQRRDGIVPEAIEPLNLQLLCRLPPQ